MQTDTGQEYKNKNPEEQEQGDLEEWEGIEEAREDNKTEQEG